jgi:hypothetical protein
VQNWFASSSSIGLICVLVKGKLSNLGLCLIVVATVDLQNAAAAATTTTTTTTTTTFNACSCLSSCHQFLLLYCM